MSFPSTFQISKQLGGINTQNPVQKQQIKDQEASNKTKLLVAGVLTVAAVATGAYLYVSPTAMPALKHFIGTTVPEYFAGLFGSKKPVQSPFDQASEFCEHKYFTPGSENFKAGSARDHAHSNYLKSDTHTNCVNSKLLKFGPFKDQYEFGTNRA